jgi:hypothetical protein
LKPRIEECGQQVNGKEEIASETILQILSPIECEYNAEMLKRKARKISENQNDRTFELYVLGLNTLEALMIVLRLKQEWDLHVKAQYALQIPETKSVKKLNKLVSADQVIKLLTRCTKMYEAKQMVLRLLQVSLERDRLVKDIQRGIVP